MKKKQEKVVPGIVKKIDNIQSNSGSLFDEMEQPGAQNIEEMKPSVDPDSSNSDALYKNVEQTSGMLAVGNIGAQTEGNIEIGDV